eukprot:492034-Prymnesium_polylepis.1
MCAIPCSECRIRGGEVAPPPTYIRTSLDGTRPRDSTPRPSEADTRPSAHTLAVVTSTLPDQRYVGCSQNSTQPLGLTGSATSFLRFQGG